ncbi:50S ribosomal protein L5 [Thermosulfuriphilus ammonigenes]|uniref:Large ribosomal subunit protein uL5 n=1 Tax=Thermosulfuriphilus ammonigenes TaxID=1936021 RepID=A0A6G7PUG8_9BACT|nr:50S ribosomal protein L5 [Thermosulfuriphilus ammonigenes]MBA2848531.1 large subunit ribosomal protein L5 [Thermosulfuriphilus ammonigenes]QIJ71325.1 50S ribosomal protein L5 [Thermosulfuriphilus ammonigenes]
MPWLKEVYQKECVPKLMEKFGYKNPMEVPRLEKIVLNMGLGEAIQNPKIIDSAMAELGMIAGQRPVIRRAKKSIAAFKLRAGMPIGVSVTLRKGRMWDFLTKLIHVALPRVRDFRGVSPHSFDGRGNYTLGVKEHIIFPEVDYNTIDKVKGMNVTIVTTAETDEEAKELLTLLGMPFKR